MPATRRSNLDNMPGGDAMFGTGANPNPPRSYGPRPTGPVPPSGRRKPWPKAEHRTDQSGRSSSTQPLSSGYQDQELVSRLRQLWTIARNERRNRHENWIRNYRLVHSKFNQNVSSWMPSPKDSEIYPALSSMVAWMTDQQISMDFVPTVDPSFEIYDQVNNIADDLSAVMFSNWSNEDYDSQIKLGIWDAFIYGIGIFKNVWDNSRAEGMGNAILRRVDPWAFYPDPRATSFDDMEYTIEAHMMSLDEIVRRYPDAEVMLASMGGSSVSELDARPSSSDGSSAPRTNPGALSGAATQWNARNSSGPRASDPTPSFVVYEYWIKENHVWYDEDKDADQHKAEEGGDTPMKLGDKHVETRWRVVVLCADHILLNELASDLWSHAQHPYERYTFDDIGEFYGIALVDHLAYPQIYINRLLTAIQHNTELTGNPVLVEAENSGSSRVGIVNRPGQRIALRGPAGMSGKPEWLVPPPMPTTVMELIQFWINRIENICSLSGMQKGMAPTQRSAEGILTSVQEAAFVRVRSALHNLESTLRRCTMKLADLVVDNYTEPRIMGILGPDGRDFSIALQERHFYTPTPDGEAPLRFMLVIGAGSTTPTSRQARIAETDKLFALGVVDDEYVLQTYQIRHIEEILKRKYEKMQMGLLGGGPGARQRAGRTS